MRFEGLLWLALAMLLSGGVRWWDGDSIAGDVSGGGEYQAAAGGSMIPPPPPAP